MDRDEILRRAEKLLRQGRLDAAIAEYEKLVEDAPRDWVSANILGDLYVRAGQIDQAVAQYTRVAEHFAREGFVSRATALYKKIVKIHPDDDAALRRAAELSASQGLTAEARLHLHALFQQRLRRGDRTGAAEAAALLADLDPSNAAGRVESARLLVTLDDAAGAAAQLRSAGQVYLTAGKPELALQAWRDALGHNPGDEVTSGLLVDVLLEAGDPDGAGEVAKTAAHWRAVAGGLARAGRKDAASEALEKVLQADASDVPSRVHLAREAIARHDAERARELLAPLSGSSEPVVLLAQAEVDFRSESIERGRATLMQSLASCGDLVQPAIDLGCEIGRTAPETGFAVITAVVQHAESMSDSDLARFRANVRAARGQIYPENWPLWVGFGKDGGYPHRGKIDFAATSLSATTGTLLLRGILPNPDGKILPGLFAQVRVPLQLERPALLVPQETVDRDQSGAHVLVVDEKNLVKRLSVKTGAVVDHSEVIEEGLTGSEWIIVKGHLKAAPGKQVTPVREGVGTGRAGS